MSSVYSLCSWLPLSYDIIFILFHIRRLAVCRWSLNNAQIRWINIKYQEIVAGVLCDILSTPTVSLDADGSVWFGLVCACMLFASELFYISSDVSKRNETNEHDNTKALVCLCVCVQMCFVRFCLLSKSYKNVNARFYLLCIVLNCDELMLCKRFSFSQCAPRTTIVVQVSILLMLELLQSFSICMRWLGFLLLRIWFWAPIFFFRFIFCHCCAFFLHIQNKSKKAMLFFAIDPCVLLRILLLSMGLS